MKRAIISTPMPTLEEVAKTYGISKSRQNQLLSIVRKHTTRFGAASGQGIKRATEKEEKEVLHRSKK